MGDRLSPPGRRRPVGVYLHVPFCTSRCAYCTFVTTTETTLMPRALAALESEIGRWPGRGARPLATLYLGGGTPSLVADARLQGLLAAVLQRFDPVADAEVTLEANPDDVTPARVRAWAAAGVSRVSLGVQSFADPVLEMLGRRHSAAQAEQAARAVRAAGLVLSVDVMLGLPGQARAQLDATLERVVALRPEHVSVYLLEMDKPHRLKALAARRPDLFPDDDEAARQYLAAGRALVVAGYRHYEISNFALPGFAARHNTRYWLGLPVLAAGVAAHGQAGRRRWANLDDLGAYLKAIESGSSPRAWSRALVGEEVLRERLMVGWRLARGVAADDLARACAVMPGLVDRVVAFRERGLLRERRGRHRLTPRGWLVSNELLETLVS